MCMNVDLPDPRPDDRDELAGVDAERDTAERVDEVIAHAVLLGEIACLEQRHQLVVDFAGAGGILPAKAYAMAAITFSAPAMP